VEITEAGRHRMYSHLEAVLGEEDAAMLMEHLPPVGWADVATKQDLALMRSDLERGMAQLESRVVRTLVFALLASNTTLAALAFGAARLGQ
jgi:hypothetical protein